MDAYRVIVTRATAPADPMALRAGLVGLLESLARVDVSRFDFFTLDGLFREAPLGPLPDGVATVLAESEIATPMPHAPGDPTHQVVLFNPVQDDEGVYLNVAFMTAETEKDAPKDVPRLTAELRLGVTAAAPRLPAPESFIDEPRASESVDKIERGRYLEAIFERVVEAFDPDTARLELPGYVKDERIHEWPDAGFFTYATAVSTNARRRLEELVGSSALKPLGRGLSIRLAPELHVERHGDVAAKVDRVRELLFPPPPVPPSETAQLESEGPDAGSPEIALPTFMQHSQAMMSPASAAPLPPASFELREADRPFLDEAMTTMLGAAPRGPALPFESESPAPSPPPAGIDELMGETLHVDPNAPKAPATPFKKKD